MKRIKELFSYLCRIKIIVTIVIKQKMTPERIINIVTEFYELPKGWHKNKCRKVIYSIRRFEAMVLIKQKNPLIDKESIPGYFDMSRSMIYHAERTIDNSIQSDAKFRKEFESLQKFINKREY